MHARYFTELDSPIGTLTIAADRDQITLLTMQPAHDVPAVRHAFRSDDRLAAAREQVQAYFAGELRAFALPLAPHGTAFQLQVWTALQRIPFGETTTYGTLAASLGMAGAARAIGAANRTNPIGIIVPCHRVIGADGSLTGYAGGIERKRLLLAHETRVAARGQIGLELSAER